MLTGGAPCVLCYVSLQHLLPLLARPGSWDVLVAHYLGVDHAGHTYGVNSRQMEDKLAQMDDQVSTVIGEQTPHHCAPPQTVLPFSSAGPTSSIWQVHLSHP